MKIRKKRDLISKDIVYQEMYTEMRRHRDYELSAANWCTVILLAIIGGFLSLKNGDAKVFNQLSPLDYGIIKLLATVIILAIGFLGSYTVDYSSKRYMDMRNWVTDNLEPKTKHYNPPDVPIRINEIIVAILIILSFSSVIIIWIP